MATINKIQTNGTTYDIAVSGSNVSGAVASATKVNGHTVEKDVPSNAVFTDTTYSAVTTSEDGLMSSTDKTKLDNMVISFGTTTTSSTVAEKVVTVYGGSPWELKDGAIIRVMFGYANNASSPKLNVDGTGAYPIMVGGEVVTTDNGVAGGAVNEYFGVCEYMYSENDSAYIFLGCSYGVDKVGNDIYSNYLRKKDVVNNLTSSSTTLPLSANQGRVLNNKIANLSAPSFETLYRDSYISLVKYGNVAMCTFTSASISTITDTVAPIIWSECLPAGVVTCTGMYMANVNVTTSSTVGYMTINPASGTIIFNHKTQLTSLTTVTTGVFTGTLTYITQD